MMSHGTIRNGSNVGNLDIFVQNIGCIHNGVIPLALTSQHVAQEIKVVCITTENLRIIGISTLWYKVVFFLFFFGGGGGGGGGGANVLLQLHTCLVRHICPWLRLGCFNKFYVASTLTLVFWFVLSVRPSHVAWHIPFATRWWIRYGHHA